MNILLVAESGLSLDLVYISKNLNVLCKELKFYTDTLNIKLTPVISHPKSYISIDNKLFDSPIEYDEIIIFTEKRYDNNFFFESYKNIIIVSLSDWDILTTLSKNNGIIFFIADILSLDIDPSFQHNDSTGCIYDFRWQKTAIDKAMRNSFICPTCLERIKNILPDKKAGLFEDMKSILDILGKASKWNEDIITHWHSLEQLDPTATNSEVTCNHFDVFIAYNSSDFEEVNGIYNKLKRNKLRPWIDTENILPGQRFQEVIQKIIKDIPAAAIFIGKKGLGKFQMIELQSFISQCVENDIPVIPVLLPEAEEIPSELIFLRQFNWVKFKNDINDESALTRLIAGITAAK
jgi:hypothetical protein